MNIDYKAIVAQITVLLQGIFIKHLPLAETVLIAYVKATEKRLEILAANALNGLSKDEVLQALSDEKDIFISELKSFQIAGESLAQDAINNAESIFQDIVNRFIPGA
jgi:hypothetical protein